MQQLPDGTQRRNKRTGEVQIMRGGQWVSQGGGLPSVIEGDPKQPGPQTPAQAQSDALTVEDKEYKVASQPVFDRANAIDKVRDGYRMDKRVLKYEEAEPVYISALQSPEDPAGDALLVNAFAKTLDPQTGVQQREGDSIANSMPTLETLKAGLLKQFGTDGYGNFTPEGRKRLREAVTVRMRLIADQYRLARKEHSNYIASLGLPNTNPDDIIGPFAGLPFQQAEEAYHGRGLRLGGKQVTPGPNQQPIDPAGTGDIGFNADAQADPLNPEQEAAYNLFLRTNPNATPEQLQAFAASIGADIHNAQQVLDVYRQSGKFVPGSGAILKPRESIQERTDQRIQDADGVGSAVVTGLMDPLTMGGFDKLSAVGDTLGDMFAGQQGGFGQLYNENLAANQQFLGEVQERHPYAYFGGQLAGSLALPTFGASTAGQLAKVGAGYGAAYGAGSSDSAGEALLNALGGGVTGGAVGYAVPKGLELGRDGLAAAGRKFVGKASAEQEALLRAGNAEHVPVNMLDAMPGTRNTGATLESIPGASGVINEGVAAGRDAIEGRVAQLGAGGTARKDGPMGERLYRAGERAIEGHRTQSRADYGVAERLGGTVKAEPVKAAAVARSIIGDLSETPNTNRSTLNLYKDILGDFLDDAGNLKPLSIQAIKGLRRTIRREMSARGLVGSAEDANLQSLVDAASDDMFNALRTHNPRAADAYKKADEGFSQRMTYIKDTLQKVMGTRDKPVSGEALMAKLRGMAGSGARGDSRQLASFWRSLSNEERADAAATFASQLGKKSADEPFSPSTFITNMRSIDERARIVIFGREGARSIQNLLKLSEAKKETVARLNNSRSGVVTNYRSVLSSLLFGVPGGAALAGAAGQDMGGGAGAGAVLALGVTLGSRSMAKALMNENFTRLLLNAPPSTSPRAINAHVGKMRQLAAKDPNLRGAVQEIEKGLLSAANDNLGRSGQIAASPNQGPSEQE